MPKFKEKIKAKIIITPERFVRNCSDDQLNRLRKILKDMDEVKDQPAISCRECGWTRDDCFDAGRFWVEPNLCGACAARQLLSKAITPADNTRDAYWKRSLTDDDYTLVRKVRQQNSSQMIFEIYGWVTTVIYGDSKGKKYGVIPTSCDTVDLVGVYENSLEAMQAVVRRNGPDKSNSFFI